MRLLRPDYLHPDRLSSQWGTWGNHGNEIVWKMYVQTLCKWQSLKELLVLCCCFFPTDFNSAKIHVLYVKDSEQGLAVGVGVGFKESANPGIPSMFQGCQPFSILHSHGESFNTELTQHHHVVSLYGSEYSHQTGIQTQLHLCRTNNRALGQLSPSSTRLMRSSDTTVPAFPERRMWKNIFLLYFQGDKVEFFSKKFFFLLNYVKSHSKSSS